MKAKEIQGMSEKELRAKLAEEKLSLTKFRMQHAVAQSQNPMRIREGRKLIARIYTELRTRQLAAANQNITNA